MNKRNFSLMNCLIMQISKTNDTIIPASFYEIHDEKYYISIQYFNIMYNPILSFFKSKINLKFDKLIDELDKTIDISPIFCINQLIFGKENDLFVSKNIEKVNDVSSIETNKYSTMNFSIIKDFKSFHNGGAFFFTIHLFDSLLHLFKLGNFKIFRLLSFAKFKKPRIKLSIFSMKKLIALLFCHQSLVSRRNYTIHNILLPCLNILVQIHL